MHPFERFEAWRQCHLLTLAIYRLTASWPWEERYGLVSQVRRAAVSVELNIAEGSAKRGSLEFRRFLDISLGSLAEVACLLRIASDLGYPTASEGSSVEDLRARASRLTWRLYESVARRPARPPS